MYSTVPTSLNHFVFNLPKKGYGADLKKLAPAPAQILYRLRLQPKNLGSDRFRLRNTEYNIWRKEKKKRKKYDVSCVVG